LGGAVAEVDGESYAVAAKAAENENLFAEPVVAEDGPEVFAEKNGAAPTMGDANVGEGRMHVADAGFEPGETLRGDAFADVEAEQVVEAARRAMREATIREG